VPSWVSLHVALVAVDTTSDAVSGAVPAGFPPSSAHKLLLLLHSRRFRYLQRHEARPQVVHW